MLNFLFMFIHDFMELIINNCQTRFFLAHFELSWRIAYRDAKARTMLSKPENLINIESLSTQ